MEINVRSQVLISAAGVKVDNGVAAPYNALLKKSGKLFGVGTAYCAGENAVQVFPSDGKTSEQRQISPS